MQCKCLHHNTISDRGNLKRAWLRAAGFFDRASTKFVEFEFACPDFLADFF
jgi:hypothetical protein